MKRKPESLKRNKKQRSLRSKLPQQGQPKPKRKRKQKKKRQAERLCTQA